MIYTPKETARPLILLVDDEEEILVALHDLLEDQYDILSATDPIQALDLLRQNESVTTIISDQRMPGLTGDRFLVRAREISDARSILLTGYAELDTVITALNQGRVQAYVNKPWDPSALRSLVWEVTQHCLAQRALRTEQALLRGLMEVLPVRLVFSDAEGHCIRSNAWFRSEKEGTDELMHYPQALRSRVAAMREEVRRHGKQECLIAETVCDDSAADGEVTHWHEVTRLALAWPQGASYPEAWQVCMDRDVTRRVALENRLRQTERLQALGTLAGGVAHDFNNLLAAISGSLEVLEEVAELDEAARGLLRNAQDAAHRGANLTRRLLQFGRPKKARLGPVRVGQLLRDLQGLLEQSLHGRETEGKGKSPAYYSLRLCDAPESLPAVWSDPDQLEMALLNLCVNARDAMPNGGEVSIRVRVIPRQLEGLPAQCCADRAIALDVIDEGEGMPPEVVARIFDPFFTTKDVGRGTGLGLSGVYSFITRSHGDILVDSTPGKGTRMTLVLPVALDETQHRPDRALAYSRPATVSRSSLLRILVVDDEASVRLVVKEFLAQDGHNVCVASSLETALEQIEGGFAADLAVIDVRMPRHDGRACAEALRARFPDLKILFMSGDAAHAPLAGERLLLKPFTQEKLRDALWQVLQD